VAVHFINEPAELHRPDLVILPGTRTTVRALAWLHACGFAEKLQSPGGPPIIGICGGCQLLGKTIVDPDGVESDQRHVEGLGLLDLDTRFVPSKTLTRVRGAVITGLCDGSPVIGYEVHHGSSERRPGAAAWLRLSREPGG